MTLKNLDIEAADLKTFGISYTHQNFYVFA